MTKSLAVPVAFCALWTSLLVWAQNPKDWRKSDGPARVYNTAKKKLMEGKQIVGVHCLVARPEHLLRRSGCGFRLHLDRNAAQPA